MRKEIIQIILITVLSLAFLTCGKKKNYTDDPIKYGGTLVVGTTSDIVSLDPTQVEDAESITACVNIFEGLLSFKIGSSEIEPGLAERWDIAPDGLAYTFYLRKNVTFHDGTPMNAKAVVYSFERQRDPKHPMHNLYTSYIYWGIFSMNELVKSVRAIDDYTVEIKLNQKNATFLSLMAMPFTSIISPSMVDKYGKDFASNPIGTGPFKFVKWERGKKVIFEAYDDYWNGRPYLDSLYFEVEKDESVRIDKLKSGQFSMLSLLTPVFLNDVENDPNLKVIKIPNTSITFLSMNMKRKPFNDPRVRLAIYYSISKLTIIDKEYTGLARTAKNPFPPGLVGYDDSIIDYAYNPVKAKQLLASAGMSKGFKTTLSVPPVGRPYLPDTKRMGKLIQENLKTIGITTELTDGESFQEYLARCRGGKYDIGVFGWTADIPDPDNFFGIMLDGSSLKNLETNLNYSFYDNPSMNKLIHEGRGAIDPTQRNQIYLEACQLFHKDVPFVPLVHSYIVIPMNKNIYNFQPSLIGSHKYKNTYFKKEK